MVSSRHEQRALCHGSDSVMFWGSFGGLSSSFSSQKAVATHNDTIASLIQKSKMQYRKQNCLRNLSTQYSIYYMNHGKVVYITNILPLTSVIRSLQLDIPFACCLGYIYCQLPLTLVSGSIFAIYTSLLWFTYIDCMYVHCMHTRAAYRQYGCDLKTHADLDTFIVQLFRIP